jgi:hypothetical protein
MPQLLQLLRRFGAPLFCLCLMAALAATSESGQRAGTPAPTAPDVKTLGPQVGARVPDFSLPDQHGQTRTLSSLMGPKGLILVFNRSADW